MISIHKAGAKEKPENYRILFIQDPIMQIFTKILTNRVTNVLETNSLLPEMQMGSRARRSTISACFTLSENTKILVFHKGRLPKTVGFNINGNEVERVIGYKYLGMIYKSGLSFSKHV